MARYTLSIDPIKVGSKSASVDYKSVGESGVGYTSVDEAKLFLGKNGVDTIVAGLRFLVRKSDGTVSEYMFTKDDGTCVEVTNDGPITISSIYNIINN